MPAGLQDCNACRCVKHTVQMASTLVAMASNLIAMASLLLYGLKRHDLKDQLSR